MNIFVAIKSAATLDDEDPELLGDGTDVDPDYLDWELNAWDSFALEAAVQLREAEGGEVVAVTVADEDSEDALRESLARGADRAVRVWDDAAEIADPLTVAMLLAAVARREDPDLILCGAQSSDFASGAVGAALAADLGLPRAAVVNSLSFDSTQRTVTVGRELEGGLVEELRLPLPVLLTVQTGINEPRYPSLRAIKQAEANPISVLDLASFGLDEDAVDAARGAHVRAIRQPMGGHAEMIEGSPAEIATRLVAIVQGSN